MFILRAGKGLHGKWRRTFPRVLMLSSCVHLLATLNKIAVAMIQDLILNVDVGDPSPMHWELCVVTDVYSAVRHCSKQLYFATKHLQNTGNTISETYHDRGGRTCL